MATIKKVSPHGLAFIRRWEGSRDRAYYCPANVLTIGVGHALTRSELASGDIIIKGIKCPYNLGLNNQQINDLLKRDVRHAKRAINSNVRATLEQHQYDALASFIFNIGVSAFKSSTLLKRINDKADNAEIIRQFKRWKWSGGEILTGLLYRREAEAQLFIDKEY